MHHNYVCLLLLYLFSLSQAFHLFLAVTSDNYFNPHFPEDITVDNSVILIVPCHPCTYNCDLYIYVL